MNISILSRSKQGRSTDSALRVLVDVQFLLWHNSALVPRN
jgi:hypothetical protein